mgnify:FL=1
MEPNPITPTDVAGWCSIQAIDDAQLVQDIWGTIRVLDQWRMSEHRKSRDADRGKAAKK